MGDMHIAEQNINIHIPWYQADSTNTGNNVEFHVTCICHAVKQYTTNDN